MPYVQIRKWQGVQALTRHQRGGGYLRQLLKPGAFINGVKRWEDAVG